MEGLSIEENSALSVGEVLLVKICFTIKTSIVFGLFWCV